MNDTNNGIIVNGGKMKVNTIIQQNTAYNKWEKVDNWIDKHKSNIKNYELLQEQINELKKLEKIDSETKESIFKKVLDSIGSISDGIEIIQLIKEIF
jgi:hypothetical protein